MSVSGEVALVTGSTSGIGLGIAEALAAAGASVILHGLGDPEENARIARDLAERHGVRCEFIEGDLSKPAQCEALIVASTEAFGAPTILVNNAGTQFTSRVENFPPERWDLLLAVNLSSVFHLCRSLLPSMRKRGRGRIINIASVHGQVASVEKSAYVAAKHGLLGLTKVIALENADLDITCNAICPGWVRTPLVEQQIEAAATRQGIDRETAADRMLGMKQPMKRFTDTRQVGELALFLCSPAARTMTGTTLTIDGGWTAQ